MELLTPSQASEILKVSISTLALWRSTNTGPAYIRITKQPRSAVRYRMEDLKEYIESQMVTPTNTACKE